MQQASLHKHPLAIIFLILLFDEIGLSIGYPVLPFLCFDSHSTLFAITTSHAVRSIWYGVFTSLPHLIPIISIPILALLSDHYGRKKILLPMTCGIFVFSLFTAFGIMYGLLSLILIGAVIGGLLARSEPLALTIVGDCSTPKKKIIHMGYLQFVVALGALIGPLTGGYFAKRFFFSTLNFSMPYFIGAIAGLITFALTFIFYRETLKKPDSIRQDFSPWKQLAKPNILKLAIILVLTQITWGSYYQFMPSVLKLHFAMPATMIGIFMGIIALWLILISLFGIKTLARYLKTETMLKMAIFILLFGALMNLLGCLLPISTLSKSLIWIASIPVTIGDLIIYTSIVSLLSNHMPRHHQGKTMGLLYMLVSIVWASTGMIGGLLTAINYQLPIIVGPISLLILLSLKPAKKLFWRGRRGC